MKRHLSLLLVAVLLLPLGCGKEDPTSPFATLTVATATLSAGIVSVVYDATLGATGGDQYYVWAITDGALPAGLSLASSGAITGTPTAVGSTPFTVQVTSGDGQTAAQQLTIVIGGLPVLLVSPCAIPSIRLSVPFSVKLCQCYIRTVFVELIGHAIAYSRNQQYLFFRSCIQVYRDEQTRI